MDIYFMCVRKCKTIYLLLSHFVLFFFTLLFVYLTFSLFPCSLFCCLPHYRQFARHGDKISEKKEQNVRMEKASFVFVIMVVFKLVFFLLTHFKHERIMQYSLSFQFVLFTIAQRGEVILRRMEICACGIHL